MPPHCDVLKLSLIHMVVIMLLRLQIHQIQSNKKKPKYNSGPKDKIVS